MKGLKYGKKTKQTVLFQEKPKPLLFRLKIKKNLNDPILTSCNELL